MSVYGPASAFLLVGGRDISSDTFVLDENLESTFEETHGLGSSWETYVPPGIGRIALEASGGLYNDETDRIVDALQAQGETKQIVAYGFSGDAVGQDVVMLNGDYVATWKRIASRQGLTKAHGIHQINAVYRRGQILHGLTAETSDPGTGSSADRATSLLTPTAITSSSVASPTVITTPVAHGLTTNDVVLITGHSGSTPDINGGDGYPVTVTGTYTFTIAENVTVGGTGGTFVVVSLRGAIADLHIPALTLGGFTDVLVEIEHAPDDSTFTPLVSFSAATAVGAERVTTATVVQRYCRMTWDFEGSGSNQSVVPFVALGLAV